MRGFHQGGVGLQLFQRPQQIRFLAFVGDDHDVDIRLLGASALEHGFHGHRLIPERTRDIGEYARPVYD